MNILVINVGSTSLKYKLLNMQLEATLARGKVERIGGKTSPFQHSGPEGAALAGDIEAPDCSAAIGHMLVWLADRQYGGVDSLDEIDAVGFKTVLAGPLTGAQLVTDQVMAAMTAYNDAAPAHNPYYIAAIQVFQDLMPGRPLVAVFETAFHTDIPDYAYIYSTPYEWYEKHGVRRYGFHSASLRYVAQRVPALLGRPTGGLRLIACHLGGSSSICAIRDGRSMDTSMGFTPQAGVPMGTRCGDIDPFILPFIMDREHLSSEELRAWLTRRSGLLGISGLSADVRDLETAAAAGHRRAALALEAYAYGVKKYIGAYAAALGGLDSLAFSGGIGENATAVRARICAGLGFLGIELDPDRNAACLGGEGFISPTNARVPVLVVPTDEELIVARETGHVVAGLGRR